MVKEMVTVETTSRVCSSTYPSFLLGVLGLTKDVSTNPIQPNQAPADHLQVQTLGKGSVVNYVNEAEEGEEVQ